MDGDAEDGDGVHQVRNALHGGGGGPVVQTGMVHGGVHFYQPGPVHSPDQRRLSGGTHNAPIVFVAADGEQSHARQLAGPLRAAGYRVADDRTITIDESAVSECRQILRSGSPIVLCATARAIGSRWTREILDGATADFGDRPRVFAVQLDADADIESLTTKVDVAQFDGDLSGALNHLLRLLYRHFPLVDPLPIEDRRTGDRHFLDRPTNCATFDVEALVTFRRELREEVAAEYPAELSGWEFLERAGLWVDGRLTGTGALLFARNPIGVVPTAMVKCTRYFGSDRSAPRDTRTFEGTVPSQIVAARRFVAERVARSEIPNAHQAQSATEYDFPMVAVREIIANGLVHRDYCVPDACVHVRIFSDRIEVSSPGGWLGRNLPSGTESSLADLIGQSAKRNFQLARVLGWIWLVEGDGSGIPTAVSDCNDLDCPLPTVIEEHSFVTVTLRPRPRQAPPSGRHPAAAQPDVRPATLPAPVAEFVGRADEVRLLSTMCDPEGPSVCVVHGMAGVGKTTLTVFWAHRVAHLFPDGQLFLDLRGFSPEEPMDVAEALTALLTALGVPPAAIPTSVDAQAMLYRSRVASRRLLVVLDNARSAEQILPLLPGDPNTVVVITSRNRLTGLVSRVSASSIVVEPLTADEASALMHRLIGERVLTEPAAAAKLITRSAGLPLALAIVAAHAASNPTFPLTALVDELETTHDGLDALSTGDGNVNIRAVLSWSYRALRPQTAAVLRSLGLHPGPDISLHTIAALAGLARPQARVLAGELTRAHLLDELTPGRYRFHDLVRAYAVELTMTEWAAEERQTATRRMLDYYLHSGVAAVQHLDPHWEPAPLASSTPEVTPFPIADRDQAVVWFMAEHATLLLLAGHAAANGFDTHAWQLLWTVAPFLDQRGLWREWVAGQQTALAAAERLDDPVAQARVHHSLGCAYNQFGRYADAIVHLERALDLSTTIGDLTSQAHTHLAVHQVYERQSRYADAHAHAQHAWDLFRTTGNARGEARALNVLGGSHLRQGRYRQALIQCEQALDVFHRLGDRHGEAAVMDQLGAAHYHLGRYDQAVRHYDHALIRWEELGDRYNEAVTRAHLGDVHRASGAGPAARAMWQQALTLLSGFADPDAETLVAKLAELDQDGETER